MTWDAKDRQRCVDWFRLIDAGNQNVFDKPTLDDLRNYEHALGEALEALERTICPGRNCGMKECEQAQALLARYTIEKEPTDG